MPFLSRRSNPPARETLFKKGLIAYRIGMWLNQRTVDAIRIMAALAQRWPARWRTSDIPEETGISFMNVQKTVHALGLAQLLETHRGRSGGVQLARAPETITISEIVRVFEPKDCPVNFLMASTVDASISKLLFEAHRGFFHPLERITLAELGYIHEKAARSRLLRN
ncbi:MAG: hypothetical protein CFE31_17455 [Rhizobiales bacterium PAR1]|nr:MAG: hypothetical protein CFE31_17455 [Rhizobiales bacterium PAR1]